MEGTGGAPTSQQYKSSVVSPTSSVPKQQNHYSDRPCLDSSNVGSRMHQFTPNLSPESGQNSKKSGIPSPHPHLPPSPSYSGSHHLRTQNYRSEPSHARSLSQPQIFSLDCLLPLTPSPYREPGSTWPTSLSDPISMDVPKEELYTASRGGSSWRVETSQHRRGHRRSNSDIPFGFSTVIHSSPQGNLDSLIPGRASSGVDSTMQSAKQELYSEREGERKSEREGEREVVDDLFTTYMNLDSINSLNSSGIGANNFDSRASGTKRSGGDNGGNDVKISKNGNPNGGQGKAKEREEEVKRSEGDNVAPTQHFRSVSMDGFITDAHFGNESPKPPPSPETQLAQKFQVDSLDDNSANFRLGFGNGEFSAVEMEKIMANERLAEMASSDPKRAKRILANRQSAARSKERKMRYISELEHKVQTLQTEATTLSAQVTLLQRDTATVTSQNSELKFRIQAMEQEAQLKDALNQTLSVEVQRLRLAAAGLNGDSQVSSHAVKTALYESSDVPPTGSTPPSAGSGSKCQRQ